jgi:hypothetical protein
MSDFFGKLKSGAGKAAFEADKMVRVNRIQSEIGQLKKQIDALYMKLGEMTYRRFISQEPESPEVADVCQNIVKLEQQIGAKGEDIKRINTETFQPQGAPSPAPMPATTAAQPPVPSQATSTAPSPQVKYCTNCGKEMAVTVKFCPDCGTKMA